MISRVGSPSPTLPREFRGHGVHALRLLLVAGFLAFALLGMAASVTVLWFFPPREVADALPLALTTVFALLLGRMFVRLLRQGPATLRLDATEAEITREGRRSVLRLSTVHRVSVVWGVHHNHQQRRSVQYPVVRLESSTGAWIDLEVTHSPGTSSSFAVSDFDVDEVLRAVWPQLPWPEVEIDDRVLAYMSTGNSAAFFPRREQDGGA